MNSSPIVDALLAEMDDVAIRRLAERLAPFLTAADDVASPLRTPDETAAYLRCDRRRVYDLARSGALPARNDGRRLLFHRDDIDRYLTSPEQGVAAGN